MRKIALVLYLLFSFTQSLWSQTQHFPDTGTIEQQPSFPYKPDNEDLFPRFRYSPDGKYLVATNHYLVTIWEVSTGKFITSYGNNERKQFSFNNGLFFTVDGKYVYTRYWPKNAWVETLAIVIDLKTLENIYDPVLHEQLIKWEYNHKVNPNHFDYDWVRRGWLTYLNTGGRFRMKRAEYKNNEKDHVETPEIEIETVDPVTTHYMYSVFAQSFDGNNKWYDQFSEEEQREMKAFEKKNKFPICHDLFLRRYDFLKKDVTMEVKLCDAATFKYHTIKEVLVDAQQKMVYVQLSTPKNEVWALSFDGEKKAVLEGGDRMEDIGNGQLAIYYSNPKRSALYDTQSGQLIASYFLEGKNANGDLIDFYPLWKQKTFIKIEDVPYGKSFGVYRMDNGQLVYLLEDKEGARLFTPESAKDWDKWREKQRKEAQEEAIREQNERLARAEIQWKKWEEQERIALEEAKQKKAAELEKKRLDPYEDCGQCEGKGGKYIKVPCNQVVIKDKKAGTTTTYSETCTEFIECVVCKGKQRVLKKR